ncbi:MAG TPA: gamma-glutamylcyclotransferase family protein [Roseiarcus sp.]|nr:gamma-glutamylcyclotransferase family protein [Roseiarcus sp.]
MPLYFAYGSNIDAAAMARRCPRSAAVGPARLVRHRLAAMREGWLTVVRDPRQSVHGILWNLALADMPALDRYEGVASGLYRKALQSVATESGAKRALVYFGANAGPGAAAPDYIAAIVAAARQWGLPVAALEAFLPGGASATEEPKEIRVRPRFPFDR